MKIKSFDRREALMDAALEEFSAKSYEEASLNNIIKLAGISKGTFYYHFQDKQALYLELINNIVAAKIEFMDRKLKDYVHDEGLNIFDNLKLQSRIGIEFAREYSKYYLLGLMFLKERGNQIYATVMDMLGDTTENYYENLLEKAAAKGDFRDDVSTRFIKKVLPYLLYRYDEIFNIKSENYDIDRIVEDLDSLIDFIRFGIGNRGSD
jgi:AcrR family transcriptional regulator